MTKTEFARKFLLIADPLWVYSPNCDMEDEYDNYIEFTIAAFENEYDRDYFTHELFLSCSSEEQMKRDRSVIRSKFVKKQFNNFQKIFNRRQRLGKFNENI